jgi:shikimate kinase
MSRRYPADALEKHFSHVKSAVRFLSLVPSKRKFSGIREKRGPVWLILGPSGAGKSCFGRWLEAEQNWLHLEVDRYPEDGIDSHNLRGEWDEFYRHGNPNDLAGALQQRLEPGSKTRGVLTFPGNLVLSPDQMTAATQTGMRTIYLYGSAAHCITAFLNRERQTGRNLDLRHWLDHNRESYMRMSEPAFDPYRIHVFTHMGTHRPHAHVFGELLTRERQ